MEIGQRMRALRQGAGLTQDELAERLYVSRQTISNWETGKSYPDVESVSLACDLFDVSADALLKGDIMEMGKRVSEEDRRRLREDGWLFAVLLVAGCVGLSFSLARLDWLFVVVSLMAFGAAIFLSTRLERDKEGHDVQTFREVLAFSRGEGVDEIRDARSKMGKVASIVVRVLVGAAAGVVIGVVAGRAAGMFVSALP